jgi:hypothetical protein
MLKICVCFTSIALWAIGGVAIAQENQQTTSPTIQTDNLSTTAPQTIQTDNLSTTANPLQGTIPLNSNILGNGVQFNNGLSNFPTCNQRVCGYIQHKTSPSGNESIVGLTFQIGGSSDDTRAESEKAKVEIERIKGDRDFSLQLMEKVATAIEAKNCTRARVFAQSLAPIAGYKNHWDYLKDIDAQVCMR